MGDLKAGLPEGGNVEDEQSGTTTQTTIGNSTSTHAAVVRVSSIRVAERSRREMGDIGSLMRSIENVGLLHPPVVKPDLTLIVGLRRLEAARRLGWTEIPVNVAHGFDDLQRFLDAERDENTCREDLFPSESVALGERIEEVEREAARKRQAAAGPRSGQGQKPSGSGNFPEAVGDARDKVGDAIGMSGRNYDKAKAVVHAARQDPAKYGEILHQMDQTRNVDAAYKALRELEDGNSIDGATTNEASTASSVARDNGHNHQGSATPLADECSQNGDMVRGQTEPTTDSITPAPVPVADGTPPAVTPIQGPAVDALQAAKTVAENYPEFEGILKRAAAADPSLTIDALDRMARELVTAKQEELLANKQQGKKHSSMPPKDEDYGTAAAEVTPVIAADERTVIATLSDATLLLLFPFEPTVPHVANALRDLKNDDKDLALKRMRDDIGLTIKVTLKEQPK